MRRGDDTDHGTLEQLEALDPSFRRSALNMFEAEIGSGDVEVVVDGLSDMDADVRADAAEALGRMGALSSAADLKAALGDGDGEVRTQAAVALIRLGDDSLFPQVVRSLRHDDPRVVLGAAVVLGRVADKRVVPNLVEAFQTTHEEVGAAVAWALGQCQDPACLPWLRAAVDQGFCVVHVCEAIGRIGDASAAPSLLPKVQSDAVNERAYAARALGMLRFDVDDAGKGDAVAALQGCLNDDARKVRLCAAIALYELGEAVGQRQLALEVDSLDDDAPGQA